MDYLQYKEICNWLLSHPYKQATLIKGSIMKTALEGIHRLQFPTDLELVVTQDPSEDTFSQGCAMGFDSRWLFDDMLQDDENDLICRVLGDSKKPSIWLLSHTSLKACSIACIASTTSHCAGWYHLGLYVTLYATAFHQPLSHKYCDYIICSCHWNKTSWPNHCSILSETFWLSLSMFIKWKSYSTTWKDWAYTPLYKQRKLFYPRQISQCVACTLPAQVIKIKFFL